MRRAAPLIAFVFVCAASAALPAQEAAEPGFTRGLEDGLYACVDTDKGAVVMRLFYKRAPLTVAHFVGLARGSIRWRDPKSGELQTGKPFYDGLTFHRILKGFVIQGGCPLGTGKGNPGFRFRNEIIPGLEHDAAGLVAMANSGPDTNGCQFYITLGPAPHLNGKYNIFGRVVRGLEAAQAIGALPAGADARPEETAVMKSVRIAAVGAEAEAWDPIKAGRAAVKVTEPPKAAKPADPMRVWDPKAEPRPRTYFQMMVFNYRGAEATSDLHPRDKEQARVAAERAVALARQPGGDFIEVMNKYSAYPNKGRVAAFDNSADKVPAMFKPAFCLRPGQVSDPVDTALGWMVWRGVEVVGVRQILIGFKPLDPKSKRSKDEARALAASQLARLRQGVSWKEVYAASDHKAPELGRMRTYVVADFREQFKPFGAPFVDACLGLQVGQVSAVVESPLGFHIIQRLE